MNTNMNTNIRIPLFIKGYCFGIPEDALQEGVNQIIDAIKCMGVNTIIWDGDKLTYKASPELEHVKSFTHVLPKIKAWADENDYDLEFIFGKKQKSVYQLLDGADCEIDSNHPKTNLGPFNFLKSTTTIITDYNSDPIQRTPGVNIAVSMENTVKWNKLGINMMKWIRNSGVNYAYLLIIGKGNVVNEELQELERMGDEVPKLTINELKFERISE